jgi:RND family efflux transporter MFP subunit
MSRSLLCVVVAVLGTALSSCSGPSRGEAHAEPEAAVVTVAVTKAALGSLSRQVVLTGEFRPYQSIDLHAKVAGYLRQINVDVGDRVKAGQLLATLEIPEMKDDAAQASAALERSRSELERTRSELDRATAQGAMIELSYSRLASVMKSEPGLVAQQEIDEARARQQAAAAQVAASKAALASAQQAVEMAKANQQRVRTMADYTQISAPFSGVILKRFADPGAMVQAGTASQTQAMPVVRLAQVDRLRLVVPVPQSVVPSIRIGESVTIRVAALDKTFSGKVARFTGDVQLNTRTMDTEIDVLNSAGLLMPGQYADAVFTVAQRDNVVTLPVQAVSGQAGGKRGVLAVNAQGALEERAVEVGLETPAKVEVVSGARRDDLVVVGNRGQWKPGQKVQTKLVDLD